MYFLFNIVNRSVEFFRNMIGGYQRIKNAVIVGESPNIGTRLKILSIVERRLV